MRKDCSSKQTTQLKKPRFQRKTLFLNKAILWKRMCRGGCAVITSAPRNSRYHLMFITRGRFNLNARGAASVARHSLRPKNMHFAVWRLGIYAVGFPSFRQGAALFSSLNHALECFPNHLTSSSFSREKERDGGGLKEGELIKNARVQ